MYIYVPLLMQPLSILKLLKLEIEVGICFNVYYFFNEYYSFYVSNYLLQN